MQSKFLIYLFSLIFSIASIASPVYCQINENPDLLKLRSKPMIPVQPKLTAADNASKRASEYFENRDYSNAVICQFEAISKSKADKVSDKALSRMYDVLCRYAIEADNWVAFVQGVSGQVKYYRKLQEPGLHQILTIQAGLEFQENNYDKAIKLLKESIKLIHDESGENSELLILPIELIGACHFELKNYPAATESFRKIIAFKFKNTKSRDLYLSNLYLGKIYQDQGNRTKANVFFENAAVLVSGKKPTYNPYVGLYRENLKYLINKSLRR